MPDQNKTYFFDVGDCILFNNMNENEIDEALKFFNARKTNYDKDNIIFHAGENTKILGIVLSGSVTVESNDVWGNRTILTIIKKAVFLRKPMRYLMRHFWLMPSQTKKVKLYF